MIAVIRWVALRDEADNKMIRCNRVYRVSNYLVRNINAWGSYNEVKCVALFMGRDRYMLGKVIIKNKVTEVVRKRR